MLERLKDGVTKLIYRAVELRDIDLHQQLFEEVVKDGGTIVFREGDNPPISVNYGEKYDPEEEERLKQVLLRPRPASDSVLPYSLTYLDRNGEEIGYYGEEIIDNH
ncbi:hypothetical protein A2V80_00540 [Candidatus Woesebacteria bacterium RBG_16_39_8b]|uniref:Uncharacterized protein n=1 Tax=Candidatus Woesebacteria bacterium RBG_16_39_8b TaxID=1802482 RepID=A0A1F7X806_9BACT|nr:MAG: hypothetical protein A2V80_00540 [Candidatus Woesebacteria bacterium RBG_16_39_8b]